MYAAVNIYYNLAKGYDYFSQQLYDPPSIKGAEIADLKKQLKGSADQMRSKALTYVGQAINTCDKYKVFSLYCNRVKTLKSKITGKGTSLEEYVVDSDIVSIDMMKYIYSRISSIPSKGK